MYVTCIANDLKQCSVVGYTVRRALSNNNMANESGCGNVKRRNTGEEKPQVTR